MSGAPLRDRPTVRVVLFDPGGRVLLMRGRLPNSPPEGAWFTVGGGAEPGETLEQTAMREVREETGFLEIDLGPVVWRREGPLTLPSGERVMMREHYLVARCAGDAPSRDGWDEVERGMVLDLRWWDLNELAATADRVYPSGLAALLGDLHAGSYPQSPLDLPWD